MGIGCVGVWVLGVLVLCVWVLCVWVLCVWVLDVWVLDVWVLGVWVLSVWVLGLSHTHTLTFTLFSVEQNRDFVEFQVLRCELVAPPLGRHAVSIAHYGSTLDRGSNDL